MSTLLALLLLTGVGFAGFTYQTGPESLAITGWLLAVAALAVLGIIELCAAITELRQHPEGFESADRTVDIWWYLVNTRYQTLGFSGLALIAAGILGEAIRVPNAFQLSALALGGVLAALGAYRPLLAPEEMAFFEEDSVDE